MISSWQVRLGEGQCIAGPSHNHGSQLPQQTSSSALHATLPLLCAAKIDGIDKSDLLSKKKSFADI